MDLRSKLWAIFFPDYVLGNNRTLKEIEDLVLSYESGFSAGYEAGYMQGVCEREKE